MTEIIEKTAQRLRMYKDKRLAVGVSGGRDSMCLLHAVVNCGVVDRSNILAVHVNHCLRQTAQRDEDFVKRFCEKNGVAFKAFSVDVKKTSAENGFTVEQAARDLRYGVFYELIKRGAADVILTAHHALDNAETVLMHLFRGTGLDGLRGMDDAADGRAVVRPLIDVYPDELDDYCEANNIEYVIDETNLIDAADRNFIRLNVIPLIEKRYVGAVRAVNRLAEECNAVCRHLDSELDASLITHDNGAAVIADGAFDTALASRYVRRALEYFTTVDVTREQTERIVSLEHMRTGAVVELTGGIHAAKEYNGVALYIPRPKCNAEYPVKLGANIIDGLAVDIEQSDVYPRSVKGGAVDFEKLNGAVLRFRRDGDMFTPCGGKRKKLKQFFIDSKIPKRLRDRIPLICKDNEVLVIVGVQIADSVKQTCETTEKAVVRSRW